MAKANENRDCLVFGDLIFYMINQTREKRIKQHFQIKRFRGASENAVRRQTHTAITAYCLVAIMQYDVRLDRSICEVLQILGISFADEMPLRNFFSKNKFNDVKGRGNPDGPGLFEKF